MHIRIVLLAILLAALPVDPALATTFEVTFSATNFGGYPDGSPDPTTVEGRFLVAFDPWRDYVEETTGITVNALNLTVDSPIAFTYTHDFQGSNWFRIGGLNEGVVGMLLGSNDFQLIIKNFTDGPLHSEMYLTAYTQAALGLRYFVTPNPDHPSDTPNGYARVTAVTPLPGSMILLLTAIAGLALAGQKRRGV